LSGLCVAVRHAEQREGDEQEDFHEANVLG
jgi:hypothetical protein